MKTYISLFILLIFNIFISFYGYKNLNNYIDIALIFWILITIVFIISFNNIKFKQRKHIYKYEKIFIVASIYVIIYILLGLIIGYTKNIYSLKFINIKIFIIPIICQEIIRNILVNTTKHNKKKYIFVIILFTLSTTNLYYIFNDNLLNIFYQTNQKLIPSIILNIVLFNLSKRFGLYSTLIYQITINIMYIVIPILPSTDWFIEMIYNSIFSIILFLTLKTYKKQKQNNRFNYYNTIFICIFIVLILFVSGFFTFIPVGIMSNSMIPIFRRGDVVIIKKINNKDLIKVEDIIEYKKDNSLIVHRVINIIKKNNKIFFLTKGDNNENADSFLIDQNNVIGIVKGVIPKIGYPNVLIYEIINRLNNRGEI